MKHIKKFENMSDNIFKKNDIIIRTGAGRDELFIVCSEYRKNIENINTGNNNLSVFYIGDIHYTNSKRKYTIIFNSNFAHIQTIKCQNLRKIDNNEKDIIFGEIKNKILNDDILIKYINIIYEKTGVYLYNLPEYKEWEISKDSNKYNL